ncbi:PAS-domain containing protein [Paeniroseomonas aquatica]|uniref:histidine kinase n=1 Tax=Paeniroseomonas aquatica TaxID=373043 RepID=A0ABT8AE45_9PROT|nr:PAS-domain containing protein [Paeniroseomonas aquatica]MDN3568088.1 PAS-domain containing protein [Paeniroseomonas aquatica]
MQPRRIRIAVLVVAALLLLALGSGTALLLDRMHATAEAAARQTVQRITRVAESTVNRHFLAVDGMLAGLPAILGQLVQNEQVEASAANRMLRELNFQNFSFRDLVVLRPDGQPWAAALAASRSRSLPIEEGAVAAAAGFGAAVLSGPARNALTGEWSLMFLRAMDLPGLGPLVAVAEVPVPLIATLLAPIGELPGLRISVERADGRVLVALPHDEGRMGRPLAQPASQLPADGSAVAIAGRYDDIPALAAARPILYRDIFVVASYDEEAAFAAWTLDRRRLLLVAGSLGVLLIALALALHIALRQRERIEAERTRARAVLERAIETMPDGFVMFDAEDRLVVCNQRYRDLYAISAPFIEPGAKFEDIIREGAKRGQYPQAGEDIERFVAEITAWHRSNQPSIERLLPDGRWLMVTDRETPGGGTVGIRTDITALKRAMTEIALARDSAAAATAAKSRFLAQMSHELRTPLNGVLGLAQALARDPKLSGEQQARARTLEEAGRHLVAVANDVLDLAKVESGRLELRRAPTRLDALLDSSATLVRPAAEEKQVRLAVVLGPALPEVVLVDQTRLRQLVLNLLSNAVKFTPSGGVVEVVARAVQGTVPSGLLPDGRAMIRIEVRDTGPGVPEAKRCAVFGDFVQLARDERAGGTGLGLAIAAGIAAQMEGTIGCTDNPASSTGPGAIFWVELPLQPAHLPLAGGAAAQALPARPLQVLVADDVPANLAVARALLESAGHAVTCVADGALALAALEETAPACRFDVVLMDVMMPGMDGLEATRRIRALPGPAGQVPVLAVTASAFAEDIAACSAAGMDAHLAKPIERDALIAALGRLARGRPSPARAAEAPAQLPGLASLPLLERRSGNALAIPGLDAETARRLAPVFLQEIADQVIRLQAAGPEAMEEALSAAHRLAGSAATLGANRLAAAARQFQTEARTLPAAQALMLRGVVLTVAEETQKALGLIQPPQDTAVA